MIDNVRQRLKKLGSQALADALLKLAARDDTANELVERLVATPEENISRFKTRISRLKRMRRFVDWGESAAFASELEALLDDLRAGIADSHAGVELVAAFYSADNSIFDNCDDSSGHVGDVFRNVARSLFVSYASACEDKACVADIVLKLNEDDGYGVCDVLVACAAEYLSEPVMRSMVERLLKYAERKSDNDRKRHWLHLVELLARQLKDAHLFEKARIASWGKPSTAACIDIAEVFLESGDAQMALSWLEQIPEIETFMAYERDELLLDVYGRLGDKDSQARTAWRIFRGDRCMDSLAMLLGIIGKDKREQIIAEETGAILSTERLSCSDAAFLVDAERLDDAETYILSRTGQLNGDRYDSLLPLAEAMEAGRRLLVASVIYRSLLDSILRRARSKHYSHGVRYLKKLDTLAKFVPDWRDILPHATYLADMRKTHGRKSSFWSRYQE